MESNKQSENIITTELSDKIESLYLLENVNSFFQKIELYLNSPSEQVTFADYLKWNLIYYINNIHNRRGINSN